MREQSEVSHESIAGQGFAFFYAHIQEIFLERARVKMGINGYYVACDSKLGLRKKKKGLFVFDFCNFLAP